MSDKLEIVQRIYVSDEDEVRDHYQLHDRWNKGKSARESYAKSTMADSNASRC
jgi:hypothetical protein